MARLFTILFATFSEETCVRYSEGDFFIANPSFFFLMQFLIILNYSLRVLVIKGISRIMDSGDTMEALFRDPNGIYYGKRRK